MWRLLQRVSLPQSSWLGLVMATVRVSIVVRVSVGVMIGVGVRVSSSSAYHWHAVAGIDIRGWLIQIGLVAASIRLSLQYMCMLLSAWFICKVALRQLHENCNNTVKSDDRTQLHQKNTTMSGTVR